MHTPLCYVQGTQPVPCEFIAAVQSQSPVKLDGEAVDNHDELMSNFFAQPDALACGKGEPTDTGLEAHRYFTGNRPSLSLLFDKLDARCIGQVVSFYEHKVNTTASTADEQDVSCMRPSQGPSQEGPQ